MKKLLTALALAVLFAPGLVRAEDIKRTNSDIITFQHKGSTDIALAVSSHGVIYNTEGLTNVRESFIFISSPDYSAIIASNTLVRFATTSAVWFPNGNSAVMRQPLWPSPIIFNIEFTAGDTSTHTQTGIATISGIDSKGSSRTVRVEVSTSVSTTGHAFVYISSINIGALSSTATSSEIAPLAPVRLRAGTTSQIGLANDILSPGDVYAWWENGVIITSATVNADYDWVQPQIEPDFSVLNSTGAGKVLVGNRYEALYRVRQSPPRRDRPDQP